MKLRNKRAPMQATCLFTDREEPRKAFWDKYQKAKEEMACGENAHVLTYYGIGGIGKTQLLYQLRREMNEKLPDPHHVLINFETSQDSREVLSSLKNLIEADSDGKFTFPLFELGLYIHARKMGMRADSPEAKKLTDTLFLNTISPILGFIPVVNVAASVIVAVDQLQSGIGTYLKHHRAELEQMEKLEADELKAYLPLLFARDLEHNLKKANVLLVVFMDTYERLVNELSSTGMPLENDLWIRGENGIVQNTANVLWVIAGREKLKWDLQDPDWEGGIEQHILGNLAPADSNWFLEKSGVADSDLRQQLYDLTGGTPMYLDICAGRYRQCIAEGIVPDISRFGSSTQKLVERFVRYMDDTQKSIVYALAYIRRWDDALINRIFPKLFRFDYAAPYKRAKNLSFILQSDDGSYYIHQTVGEVLQDSSDTFFADLRAATAAQLVDYYLPAVQNSSALTPGYAGLLQGLLHAGLLLHQDRNALAEFYEEHLLDPMSGLCSYGQPDQASAIFDMLWDRAVLRKDDLLYAFALREWAYLLISTHREVKRAEQMAAEAVSRYTRLLDANDLRITGTKTVWVHALNEVKRHKEALTLAEEVLRQRQALCEKDDPKILSAMTNLSYTLYKLKEYPKAVEYAEYVYSRRKEILGENHPRTLSSLNVLVIRKSALSKEEEVLSMKRDVYEKSLAALGPDHPQTLAAESNMARTLCNLENYEDALKHMRHAYETQLDLFGAHHIYILDNASDLAWILEKMKRYSEALPYRKNVYEHYLTVAEEEKTDFLYYRERYAETLVYAGEYKEALPLWEEICAHYQENSIPFYAEPFNCLQHLTDTLIGRIEYKTALPFLKHLYHNSLSAYGSTNPTTMVALQKFAITLMDNEDYETSLIYWKELQQAILQVATPESGNSLHVLVNMYLCNLYMSRWEEARYYISELYYNCRKSYPEDHDKVDAARRWYLDVLKEMGSYREGLQVSLRSYAWHLEQLGVTNPASLAVLRYLINFLVALREYPDAKTLQWLQFAAFLEAEGADSQNTRDSLKDLCEILRRAGKEFAAAHLENLTAQQIMELPLPSEDYSTAMETQIQQLCAAHQIEAFQ